MSEFDKQIYLGQLLRPLAAVEALKAAVSDDEWDLYCDFDTGDVVFAISENGPRHGRWVIANHRELAEIPRREIAKLALSRVAMAMKEFKKGAADVDQ